MSSVKSALKGSTEPRIFTAPLRRLTRKTTFGFELIDFARDVLKEPFDPWQQWLAKHMLEHRRGKLRFRTVIVLVGRQNGKTHFLKVLNLWRMFLPREHPMYAALTVGAAQSLDIAREAWNLSYETALDVDELAVRGLKQSQNNNDLHWRITEPRGPRYKIKTIRQGAGRGLTVDQLDLDELREQHDWDGWSALSKTTNARPNGLRVAISNAGDDRSVVLNHLIEAAKSGRDETVALFEWSAPEGCELDDQEGWAHANPGLGYHGPSVEAIRSDMNTDPAVVFRTEVLCQRVPNLNAAVDLDAWKACADTQSTLEALRDRVVAVVDVAPDGEHVSLLAAARGDDERVRLEVVAAWESTTKAREGLEELLDRVAAVEEAWYPYGPAAALAPIMKRREARELTGREVTEACQGFADLVAARGVVHPNDPLLSAHVGNAEKYQQGDGWRFVRRGAGHCDAAYAAAGAVHCVLTREEKPVRRAVVIVGRRSA